MADNTTSTTSTTEYEMEQRAARQSEQLDKVYKGLVECGWDPADPTTLDWAVAITTGY